MEVNGQLQLFKHLSDENAYYNILRWDTHIHVQEATEDNETEETVAAV